MCTEISKNELIKLIWSQVCNLANILLPMRLSINILVLINCFYSLNTVSYLKETR